MMHRTHCQLGLQEAGSAYLHAWLCWQSTSAIWSPSLQTSATSTSQAYNTLLWSHHPVCQSRGHFKIPGQRWGEIHPTGNWHIFVLRRSGWPNNAHKSQHHSVNVSQTHQRNNDKNACLPWLRSHPPRCNHHLPSQWYGTCHTQWRFIPQWT